MTIRFRPQATRDVDDIADYLEQQRAGYGQRFLQALALTLAALERMPGLGGLYPTTNAQLTGMRCATVRGFRSYLIFYMPDDLGIDVVRVLSGARNLSDLLDDT